MIGSTRAGAPVHLVGKERKKGYLCFATGVARGFSLMLVRLVACKFSWEDDLLLISVVLSLSVGLEVSHAFLFAALEALLVVGMSAPAPYSPRTGNEERVRVRQRGKQRRRVYNSKTK